MVRQVQVTIPSEKGPELLRLLQARDHVHSAVLLPGTKDSVILFKSVEKHVADAIAMLEKKGIGVHVGVIDIVELKSTKPLLSTFFDRRVRKKRKYKMTDRMAVEEIYESVDSQCHLTFDYLLFCFVAAMISGVGLIQDSSVTVVASMLVSPLMGPILGVTFGAVIRSPEMVWRSFRNEMWGILVCLLVGFITGLCCGPFFGPCGIESAWSATQLRSNQMESRGTIGGVVAGFFAAVPSGVGVALAITGGGINALVGVAISAALLPPVVNTGTCFALSFWYWTCELSSDVDSVTHIDAIKEKNHFLGVGAYSFALFVTNFVVIFLMALGVFKLKRVRPWITRSNFWKQQLADNPMPATSSLVSSSTREPAYQPPTSWKVNPLESEVGTTAVMRSPRSPSFDYGAMGRKPLLSPEGRGSRQRSNTAGEGV